MQSDPHSTRPAMAFAMATATALGLILAVPAGAQTPLADATLLAQSQAPADWNAYEFRGFRFSLPPGWIEMERSDEQLILFGGDPEKRTGPGFGLMLSNRPMSIFPPGGATETGQVTFANGQIFRRIEASETPQPGFAINGDILISLLPVSGDNNLIVLQSSYNEPLGQHRAMFDQILASMELPTSGEMVRKPVLGGAFLAPLPQGWETGSYNDDEVLTYRYKGLHGEYSLFRHAADSAKGFLDKWYIPDGVQPLPVMMLGQSALLYEWSHDPKFLADGTDDDAITRVYVFETCLPGPATASISLTGLPSFYDAMPVQSLIDAMDLFPGAGAAPCGAANLPKGAVIGAPEKGRRSDSGFTTYVTSTDQDGWTAHEFAGHAFALPTGWTGGDNGQGAEVYLSSTGQYQITFTHMVQAPAPRGIRAEVRLADGTRFLRLKEVEGETLVSLSPIRPEGHLVIGVTGGRIDNDTFLDILATLRLAAVPLAEPQSAAALNGLLEYSVPDGWYALVDADSLTLMAADGRGFLTVAKGQAVLPPYGLAVQVPPGRLGSFAASHFKQWTEYGWPGTALEFMDGDQPAEGWHYLNVLRGCLPGQEPVALSWGGISRFLNGETLTDLKRGLVFTWPEVMEECQLENAGVGQASVAAAPEATSPTPIPAPSPEPEAGAPVATAPTVTPPVKTAPQPTRQAQAPLAPPPPPPVVVDEPRPDPDIFTEGEGGYTLYQNARYGTFISFPGSYYSPKPAPDSGDGRTFVSADGASRFVVFAQYNALDLSQAEMMQDDRATGGYDDVTYQKAGEGWYVLSGHAAGDIYYRKVILDPSGLVQVFEITYPSSLKREFDPVVTYMVQSFGPGASPGVEIRRIPYNESLPTVRVEKLFTPARNTELRLALMNAARGPIEAETGRKVIFVVSVLRTDGNWAYLQAVPHNPNGTAINWAKTRFAKEMQQGVMSDVAMILMRRINGRWSVVDHVFGPTDVYWYGWVDEFGLPVDLFTP
ncbi:MAG: hypothetical protein Q8P60_15785 [Pseudorhodobacter sp.]|nr:hypothetical protein [Pseudorhodobacter sp.]